MKNIAGWKFVSNLPYCTVLASLENLNVVRSDCAIILAEIDIVVFIYSNALDERRTALIIKLKNGRERMTAID